MPSRMSALLGFALTAALVLGACTDDDVARGDRFAREKRWTEAVAAYEKAIARYPYNYEAAWGIAKIYCLETHHPDKCLAWTDRLLAAYPRRKDYRNAAAQGWRDRAELLREEGDEAGARAAEARAAELAR